MSTTTVNHHAHHPGFAGPAGLLAALSMSWLRDADARLAVDLTRLGATDDLLDVGCGPGAAARVAARTARSVVGVDPAPVMLRVARLRRGGPRYLEGTAERLPLPDSAVSVAWALATVHHWAEVDAALAELHRVLRPGGRLLAVEKDGDPDADGLRSHGWNRAQAEAFAVAAARHGFTDVDATEHDLGRRQVHAVLARRDG